MPVVADVDQWERPGLEDAMRKDSSGLDRKRFEDVRPKKSCKEWLRDSSSFSFPLGHTTCASPPRVLTTEEIVKSPERNKAASLLQMFFR